MMVDVNVETTSLLPPRGTIAKLVGLLKLLNLATDVTFTALGRNTVRLRGRNREAACAGDAANAVTC